MMASTSNPKQHQIRNWLDLPSDVTANILNRIGMVDILENVDKVCTAWHKICMDPAMWRVVNMNDFHTTPEKVPLVFKEAVDRSQGQLVDVTLVDEYNINIQSLLLHVADRSSQLKRLEVAYTYYLSGSLNDALMEFPLLEELNLYLSTITKTEIETIAHYCPMLKTLGVNQSQVSLMKCNEIAIAIGQNLHGLRHLELIGNKMTNIGLQVIVDNCLHLETLDLRQCPYIDMKGELGKKCSEQIKYLKLPNDSLEGYPYDYRSYQEDYDESCYNLYWDFEEFYDFD